jgi:hypothetical protein
MYLMSDQGANFLQASPALFAGCIPVFTACKPVQFFLLDVLMLSLL